MSAIAKWHNTMRLLHEMEPPKPFNPHYNPRAKEIWNEAQKRARQDPEFTGCPTKGGDGDKNMAVFHKHYKIVEDEMNSRT